MILALETATEVCSVALQLEDGQVIEKRQVGRGIHSEMLFVFLKQLMDEQNICRDSLEEVLISGGPGQYTGLRIGAAGLKGVLFGTDIPLFTLGTLEGFAAGLACRNRIGGKVHAVLDARRKHLYYQHFDITEEECTSGEAILGEIGHIDLKIKGGDNVIGTGLERLPSFGKADIRFFDRSYISAINLILARRDPRFTGIFRPADPVRFEPEYMTTPNQSQVQFRK
ncbi:MAG: tRNA (adenosine(37)-N6)-threonylcarbamoyltransferase complex dimerization subunit type 1 TsaB [Balneolaceae bacterium]